MSGAFGLLGPLAVWDDAGQQVSIRGRRPRELLAILLLEPNHAVGTTRIIDELWGQQPPTSARESVQVFVHQLRDVLPRGSTQSRFEVLKTHRSSYLLRVDATRIDVGRFELLVQQAASARQQGDRPTAWARYGEALGLWRGEALADLNDAPFAVVARARLEHHRLSAHEARLEVGLELGWHAELVGELEGLVCEHPHQEGLRALLMLALYRSGRQAEALDAYRAAREVLVEKHGMEPGARLQELQRAILAQDPSLKFRPQRAPGQSAPADGVRPQANRPCPSAAAPANAPARPLAARPTTPPLSSPRVVEEHKLVTVLAVGVAQSVGGGAGAGNDPEDVRARTNAWQRAAGERIGHYGGVVSSLAMGRLLAVFGVHHSRADDPERAVRAALEITTVPEGSSLGAGVVTGEAFIDMGRPPSDAVPVAAENDAAAGAVELQAQAAVGTVVVGAATYWATRRVIAYQLAGTQPAVWRALGPAARTGASLTEQPWSPLVERDRELQTLRRVLDRCLGDRRPQLVTLVGAPGLGKTRLVGELARLVDALPELVAWRTGHCLPDRAGSLGALAEVVKAHAGILDTDPASQVASRLDQAVAHVIADPDEAAQVTSQLRVLLGPGPTGPSLDAPADAGQGWVDFLRSAAADRPMVMVIEDLHWADPALLTFLTTLIDEVGEVPLLLVCTARTEWLERTPGWGGGLRDAVTLSLSRLSLSGVEELLDALLDPEVLGLPAATREAVVAAADGNPLYVEEYVRMLRDGPADPASVDGGQVPVPLSVKQLLTARIDTLDPDDRRLLRDAAVIGQTGWVGALAAVSGRDPQQVRQWLGRLERGGFVRRVRASTVAGETEYAFRHSLIGEVAYCQLLRAERAVRHQRAAAWIQGLRAEAGELVELVASHYRQALTLTQAANLPTAGLAEQTRLALRAAGQQAMQQGALGSAASFFEQALELWPPQDPEYPWMQVELAAALAYSCQTGHELLQVALASFRRRGDEHGVATAQGLLALLARAEAHPGQAAELTGQADAADLTQDRVDALIGRAAGLLIADRHAEADQTARQAGAAAGRLGLAGQAATARSLSARAAILAGTPDAARDAEQALAAMDLHQVPVRLLSRFSYAHARWWAGELAVCAAAVSAGRAATAAAGAPGPAVRVDAVDAGLAYAAGDWARARALAERVLAADQASYLHPWALVLLGRMDLAAGMLDAAGRAAAEAVTQTHAAMANTTAELGEVRYGQVAMAFAGRVALAAGDQPRAAHLADELLDWLRRQPARGCATPDLGWLLADLHPPGSVALPAGLPPTQWHAAVTTLAARDLTTAAARFVALGSVVDAAEVRLRRAERHAASGHPSVLQDASEVLGVFRLCGARALARRAEVLGVLASPALCPPSTRTGGRRLHEMTTSS